MTRETAKRKIEMLDSYLQRVADYGESDHEAMKMAIKALEQEPCEDMEREYEKAKALFSKVVKSEDCISREEAIETVRNHWGKMLNPVNLKIQDELMNLPSVQQEPKTGHWISHYYEDANEFWYECDRCHAERAFNTKFCPDCGCRMVEPQESEDKE